MQHDPEETGTEFEELEELKKAVNEKAVDAFVNDPMAGASEFFARNPRFSCE